jgi:SAM-dependent methyltransferase
VSDDPDRPTVRDAFEKLAVGYDEEGDTKPSNALLERPATRSLLPEEPTGRVLDAGCGAGHLAADLEARGATVVGLDASREMLGYAVDRGCVDVLRADLGAPLPFADETFDGVASSLAFHYVRDWDVLFRELRRVLVPGGWLVCSVQHPFADFAEYEDAEDYHEIERVEATWVSFGEPVTVPAYRRPLEATVEPALEAGFALERLLEPTPLPAYEEADPERYAYEVTHPNFLCLRFDAPS